MRRIASTIALALPLVAFAFNVQFSISGRDAGGEWFSVQQERGGGAFGGYLGGISLRFSRNETYDGHAVFALVQPDYNTAESQFYLWPAMNEYGMMYQTGAGVSIALGEAEARAIGNFELGYGSVIWSNCVFTARGDPYSVVLNNTTTPRTVNGVSIGAFEGKRVFFPLRLIMAQDNALSFYDLESGEQIPTPTYRNHGYELLWAGDIELRDGSAPQAIPSMTNLDQVVFADIKADGTTNRIIYAENNNPVYAGMISLTTNVQLCTWWEFDQSAWGHPKAKINGEIVCGSHNTDHLISYSVHTGPISASELSGKMSFTFTMSQDPDGSHVGGACVFKCWDAASGESKDGYAATPTAHKASISGNASTVATFRVTINVFTGEWKVEPVN